MLLAGLLVARIDRVPWFGHWLPQALCVVPALVILARTHSSNIAPLPENTLNLAITAAALVVATAAYGIVRAPRLGSAPKWILGAIAFAALAVVVVRGNYDVFHCWGDGAEVTDLNASALMIGGRERFVLQPMGRLNRVVLEPVPN